MITTEQIAAAREVLARVTLDDVAPDDCAAVDVDPAPVVEPALIELWPPLVLALAEPTLEPLRPLLEFSARGRANREFASQLAQRAALGREMSGAFGVIWRSASTEAFAGVADGLAALCEEVAGTVHQLSDCQLQLAGTVVGAHLELWQQISALLGADEHDDEQLKQVSVDVLTSAHEVIAPLIARHQELVTALDEAATLLGPARPAA